MKATALVVALLMTVAVPTLALAGDDRPYGSYDPSTGRYNYGDTDQGGTYIYPHTDGGAHDSRGGSYAPATHDDLIRTDDGTFLKKVGGGYIDTRTGRFIPGD